MISIKRIMKRINSLSYPTKNVMAITTGVIVGKQILTALGLISGIIIFLGLCYAFGVYKESGGVGFG